MACVRYKRARSRTARIYRVASAAVVVVYSTGNRLPRGSRVYALPDVTVDHRRWYWWPGRWRGGDIDEPESLGDWNTVTVYACSNRARRGVGAEGRGVIDGCHYQLTRSRHHRVGQLIPGMVPLLCGLTSVQVIHWRPRLFIIALVLYIYMYIIRN